MCESLFMLKEFTDILAMRSLRFRAGITMISPGELASRRTSVSSVPFLDFPN